MTKAANRYATSLGLVRAPHDHDERVAKLKESQKLERLRAALIEGESSGEAEPGSFERMRAAVRAAARRGQ